MRDVITLVLGGGQGTRLYPLTKYRSKPAVPMGGKYRLIDIPLSNCINSGLDRCYVLTQFNSVSLHRHIRSTYMFDVFRGGFVEILAAQQTLDNANWYQGTADAVRRNLRYLEQPGIRYVLVLSGDQLYRMDYRQILVTHQQAKADVTISAVPVDSSAASGLGIMRVDDAGRVIGFLEKPKTLEELEHIRTDPAWIDRRGIASRGRDCLANMGIYLFNRNTLIDLLRKTDYRDFGKEIFPTSIRSRHVQVHLFDGYWEDIGTIKSFYEANLKLADSQAQYDLLSPATPLFTRARFLPPTRVDGASVRNSLVADGSRIEEGAVIENSIVGLRCFIGRNVVIRNSVLMGYDFYETPDEIVQCHAEGRPPLGVGEGTVIEGSIIDKNCRIGRGVTVHNHTGVDASSETPYGMVRDGIFVIPKGTTLPDGITAPEAKE
jgi:glucose-1-phosphate adenylyltransferase